jgi:hypothetical protein
VAASTLSFLQPSRRDCLAAAGMDQVRLQLQLLELDQPAPTGGGLQGHPGSPAQGRQGPGSAWPGRWPGCGCAARHRRRPRWRPGSACDARPCRRRHSSGPRSPSSTGPRSRGCRAEQGTGPHPQCQVMSRFAFDRWQLTTQATRWSALGTSD